ncbi:hypothetical protein WJX77_004816 [Trebouxia sp. C0004]
MSADQRGELLEVVNDQNQVVGLEARSVIHSKGLRHRAVYCLVFDSKRRLLLQQRSPRKQIGPGQWDLSIAEHLAPGETYLQAAARGLHEELGIGCRPADLQGPMAPNHARKLEVPGQFCDSEFVECYRLDAYDGPIDTDVDEISCGNQVMYTYAELCI